MLMALVLAVSPWGHAVTSVSGQRADAAIQEESAPPIEVEEASAAFARGVEAFKQSRFDEAVREFSRAQELAPHPDTLFNLGLAQQRAEQHVEAWRTFEALLVEASDEQEREDILAAQAASRPHVAWLRVLAEPEGAMVCLDGAPMPVDEQGRHALLTTSGSHRLDVDRQRRSLELEGGETLMLELSIPRVAPPPSRKQLRALAGLTIGGAGAAAGLGLGAAFVGEPPLRIGLGVGAAAAATLAISTTVAALLVHRRARVRQPSEPLSRCP